MRNSTELDSRISGYQDGAFVWCGAGCAGILRVRPILNRPRTTDIRHEDRVAVLRHGKSIDDHRGFGRVGGLLCQRPGTLGYGPHPRISERGANSSSSSHTHLLVEKSDKMFPCQKEDRHPDRCSRERQAHLNGEQVQRARQQHPGGNLKRECPDEPTPSSAYEWPGRPVISPFQPALRARRQSPHRVAPQLVRAWRRPATGAVSPEKPRR